MCEGPAEGDVTLPLVWGLLGAATGLGLVCDKIKCTILIFSETPLQRGEKEGALFALVVRGRRKDILGHARY